MSAGAEVLVLTTEYPVPEKPAGGIFVHRQVRGLESMGLRCRVLRIRPRRPPFPRWLRSAQWRHFTLARSGRNLETDGITVEEIVYDPRRVVDRDDVPEMARAARDHLRTRPPAKSSVLLAHWLWPAGAVALSLREEHGIPVAAIARGSELQDWQDSRPHCRPWVERVLSEADLPLSNCEYLRRLSDEHVPGVAERMRVVHNGWDTEAFRPASDRSGAKSERGLDPERRVLLFCGRLYERKGLLPLLDAWAALAPRHRDWDLVLLGGGASPAVRKRLDALSGTRILEPGSVPGGEVLPWLQAADAFVLPSLIEGLPNSLMEAMAAGLPVVTSDCCGQAEVVEDGVHGRLVRPGCSDDLERVLGEFLSDEAGRRRWGENARRLVEERFVPGPQWAALSGWLNELVARGAR